MQCHSLLQHSGRLDRVFPLTCKPTNCKPIAVRECCAAERLSLPNLSDKL